jgi:hypothetical protein
MAEVSSIPNANKRIEFYFGVEELQARERFVQATNDEPLLYLPPLVSSGLTNRITSTSLPKTGLPGRPPQKETESLAVAESGLLHRAECR